MKITLVIDDIYQAYDIKMALTAAMKKMDEGYYISETAENNIQTVKNRLWDLIIDNKDGADNE